jgi:hypothetical protein
MSTGPAAAPAWSPSAIEEQLRSELAGVRLVAEIGLDSQRLDLVEEAVREILARQSLRGLYASYPALLVVYLAGEGLRSYGSNPKGNALWPLLSIREIGEKGPESGVAFRRALGLLGLPDFAEATKLEHALANLMPILLHAGLSASNATVFLRHLRDTVRRGYDESHEIVAYYRADPHRTYLLPQPVQRLLKYGGELAIDLVDRIIEASHLIAQGQPLDSAAIGLPGEITAALVAESDSAYAHGPQWPRPRFRIDFDSGQGPEVELPPLDPRLAAEMWRIEGGTQSRRPVDRFRSDVVRLLPPPRHGWSVEATTEDEAMKTWSRPTGMAIIFSADGDLARDQSSVTPGDVVLLPEQFELREENESGSICPDAQEYAYLSGAWSRWRLQRIPDQSHLTSIWIGPNEQTSASSNAGQSGLRIPVTRTSRATWVVARVQEAMTSDGVNVLSAPPLLDLGDHGHLPHRWRIVSLSDGSSRLLSSLPRDEAGRFKTEGLLEDGRINEIDWVARGPLGSDVRIRAVVVPGLEVVREPNHPLAPSESCAVVAAAKGLIFAGEADSVILRPSPNQAAMTVAVTDRSGGNVDLRLHIPRLEWRINDGPFSLSRCRIEIEELESTYVAIRLGLPGTITLVLRGDGESLQHLYLQPVGERGVAYERLAVFGDSARQSGLATVDLVAIIDDRIEVSIATIATTYRVTSFHLDAVCDETSAILSARFEELQPFRNREIALWPLQFPWRNPERVPIPNEARGECDLVIPTPGSGIFLAQLRVSDDWAPSDRPMSLDSSMTIVSFSDIQPASEPEIKQEPSRARDVIEHAFLTRRRIPEDHAIAAGGDLLEVVIGMLDILGARALSEPTYKIAEEALFVDPAETARILNSSSLLDDRRRGLRIAAGLLPDALDCPIEGDTPSGLTWLWRRCLPLACALIPRGNESWFEETGWLPNARRGDPRHSGQLDGLPERGIGLDEFWMGRNSEQLDGLLGYFVSVDRGPLGPGGLTLGMLEFLTVALSEAPEAISRWREEHGWLNNPNARKDAVSRTYLDALTPRGTAAEAALYPQDLLAASFHLANHPTTRAAATKAIFDAIDLTPRLATRSLLIATIIFRL